MKRCFERLNAGGQIRGVRSASQVCFIEFVGQPQFKLL